MCDETFGRLLSSRHVHRLNIFETVPKLYNASCINAIIDAYEMPKRALSCSVHVVMGGGGGADVNEKVSLNSLKCSGCKVFRWSRATRERALGGYGIYQLSGHSDHSEKHLYPWTYAAFLRLYCKASRQHLLCLGDKLIASFIEWYNPTFHTTSLA